MDDTAGDTHESFWIPASDAAHTPPRAPTLDADRWVSKPAATASAVDAVVWLPDLPDARTQAATEAALTALDLSAWRPAPTLSGPAPLRDTATVPAARTRPGRRTFAVAATSLLLAVGVAAAVAAISGSEHSPPARGASVPRLDLGLPIEADAATARRLAARVARLQGTEARQAARSAAARRRGRAAARRRAKAPKSPAVAAPAPTQAVASAVVAPPPPPPPPPPPAPQKAESAPATATPSRPAPTTTTPPPKPVAAAAPASAQPAGAAPDSGPGRTSPAP